MKEQLEFADMPWELRHCCNCDSCYWSLFVAETFLKMSFLLKINLPRKFSALENVVSYGHAPPQSREEALMHFSRRICEKLRQHHLSTTRNFWYSSKKPLYSVGIAAGWEKVSCPCRHCLRPQLMLRVWSPLSCLHTEQNRGILGPVPSVPRPWHSIWGLPIIPSTKRLARVMEEDCRVSRHIRGASGLTGLACLLDASVTS